MTLPQPIQEHRPTSEDSVILSPPHEDFGRLTVPLLGEVDLVLRLGRPLRLEVDTEALELSLGGGLEVLPTELPTASLRRIYVDFVEGIVETDGDGLGQFFAGALTVALCSALRHTVGWKPGASAAREGLAKLWASEAHQARLRRLRRRLPGVHAAYDPLSVLSIEVRGDALELAVSRPLVVRALGLSFSVLHLRWVFATATLEVVNEPLGPLRRALVRAASKRATRWLRARLPPAMAEPGYDLFEDPERREHLIELAHHLSAGDMSKELGPGGHVPSASDAALLHPRAREAAGGAASLFSAAKAALVAGLSTLRISAQDPPETTRALVTLPLGPFSSLALATDRGGDVALIKAEDGARVQATRGIYFYADQFPELAELRLIRSRVRLGRDDALELELQTEPPLGPFLEALVARLFAEHVAPRVPVAWLRERGVLAAQDGRARHLLWRQGLGDARELQVDTGGGSEIELHHQDDALVLVAPGGLSLAFQNLPQLPATQVRRIAYRWQDGALEIDGDPAFGPFGQAVLAELARRRVAPRAPAGLGLHRDGDLALDEALLARYSVEVVALPLPLLGRLELRMDPQDTLGGTLGPAELAVRSERGVLLAVPELGLALELRGLRYDLQERTLDVDAASPPGDYLVALAAACIDTLLVPLLRRALPLWPDADPDKTWPVRHVLSGTLGEWLGLGFDLSLPPGACLTLTRTPDALAIGATAPLQVRSAGESLIGEFAVESIRWRPEGEQIELVTQPPAGPLLHAAVRRLHAKFTPKVVVHALGERLGLPKPWPAPPAPPAPEHAPLATLDLPLVGPLTFHVDRQQPFALQLRRDGARLDFGAGLIVRLPELGIHLDARSAAITLLPFTVELTSLPPAGELDSWLLSHVVRGLFARVLPWFWPARHTTPSGQDVLVAFGSQKSWGPLEVCTAPGGALELRVEPEGLVLRSAEGIRFNGEALDWLPEFSLHEFTYRFADGGVNVRVEGIREHIYRESEAVGARTEAVLADLFRVLVVPRFPEWTQRLGLRILPQPPVPERDPGRITVLEAQLPAGLMHTLVHMDPYDVLVVGATRHEVWFDSERHLQADIPGLHLRIDIHAARYHLATGEVQIGEFGRLENAIVESLLRRALVAYDPAAARSEFSELAALLDRFPVDDEGRRILFDSKLARVLLPRETALVVRLSERGLLVSADPPLQIDGAVAMDYRFGGLYYSFDTAAFSLDLERDSVLAGLLRGKLVDAGEKQLDGLLRPILPTAMRTPGYRLATDPDPRATIAALIRTVAGGGWLLKS